MHILVPAFLLHATPVWATRDCACSSVLMRLVEDFLETRFHCRCRVSKALGGSSGKGAAKCGHVSKDLGSAQVAEALYDAPVPVRDGAPQRCISTDIVKAAKLGAASLEQNIDDFCMSPEGRHVQAGPAAEVGGHKEL